MKVPKRKDAAERRRRERLDTAQSEPDRLNAAFDYFRSGVKALPEAEAERARRELADQLITITDKIRARSRGEARP